MSRIWITGGRGFAGRHLARLLVDRGHRVWSIDRHQDDSEGDVPSLPCALEDARAVAGALEETSPDAIVHLAAQSSGAVSLREPAFTLRNNLDATLGILEALRHTDPARRPRLLSIGSCEEYGPPASDEELPLREDQALRPANPYAVSKAAQTLLCQQYRRSFGIEVLCARAFNHTGPGQDERFVFGSWAKQIAALEPEGGTLAVGNLDVTRDFSHVRDVVRAYADLLEVEWPHDVVNVCSGRELSLRDALQLLMDASPAPLSFVVDPERLRPSDVPRFVGDPSRLRSMLGWIPSTEPKDFLVELLESWRERLGKT